MKIKLASEIDRAIKSLKNDGLSNYAIIGMLFSPNRYLDSKDVQIIDNSLGQDKMHPDTLIEALVNGYDVLREETKRDKVGKLISEFYGYPAADRVLDSIEEIYN